jgi:hypothetical protein
MKLISKENYQFGSFPPFTAYGKVWHFDSTEQADGKYNVSVLVNLFSSQDSAVANDGTSFKQTDFKLDGVEKANLNADYLTEQALTTDEYSDWTLVTV